MRDKEDSCGGSAPTPHAEGLRKRVRADLERMGMTPQFAGAAAQRLESTVAELSPHEYSVVLTAVAAVYGIPREDRDVPDIAPEYIADVQRLMQGFGEEVQKLDEGLRMLSAYVSRLRKRATRNVAETLH